MTEGEQNDSELRQLHQAFTDAFRNGDYEALGKLYVDAAVMLLPGGNILTGRKSILEFWQRAQRIQDLQFEPVESRVLADNVLREVGNLQVTVRGAGRQTRNVSAKYTSVWLKVGGAWQLDTFAWNRAAGGQAGAGGGRPAGGGGRMGGGRGGGGGGFGRRGPQRNSPAPMVTRTD